MATSSSNNTIPVIDPDTGHLRVTVDTPPDQWWRGMYKVETIRDVLREHLDETRRNPSVLQQRSMARLAKHISNDVAPGMEDVEIDWYADIGQIANDLDVIFFRGLVNRDWQTVYYPERNGISVPGSQPDRPGKLTLGFTTWDSPGNMNMEISFDTCDLGPLAVPTRIRKRSRVLGTLLHEMVHAFFFLYACQGPDCCMDQGGDYSDLIGGDGHGPAWQHIASHMNLFLMEMFPLLEFPEVNKFTYPPATAGGPKRRIPDALGIYFNTQPKPPQNQP
ncbi:hypothetical protein PG985_003826 [Apiospora marii]|uniref:uncharacterized protein n=1 Tax=Apiospora marii TaxID=335849 RepID=UPI00312E73B3